MLSTPTMLEAFEEMGRWWPVGSSRVKTRGTLRFRPPDGLSLELVVSTPAQQRHFAEPHPSLVIHGTTDAGRRVTLMDCFVSGSRQYFATRVSHTTVMANRAVIGAHLRAHAKPRFPFLAVRLTHFDEWNCQTGIAAKHGADRDSLVRADYNFVPTRQFHLPALRARLSISSSFTDSTPRVGVLHWDENWWLNLSYDTPQPLDRLLQDQGDLATFLSLLIGDAVHPLRLTLKTALMSPELDVVQLMARRRPDRVIHAQGMLLPHPSVQHVFGVALNRWYERREALRSVYDLVGGTLYDPDLYPSLRFLMLAQAAETFHRQARSGTYVPKRDFRAVARALKRAIPSNVPGELRQALVSRIDFGNDLSLRTRLTCLVDEVPWDVQSRYIGLPDHFVRSVAATRNYLTHHPPSLPRGATAAPEEQHRLAQQLRVLLTWLLLAEAGIPKDILQESVVSRRVFADVVLHTG